MGDGYKFGMGVYATLKEFIDHFDNQPLIAGETGKKNVNSSSKMNELFRDVTRHNAQRFCFLIMSLVLSTFFYKFIEY